MLSLERSTSQALTHVGGGDEIKRWPREKPHLLGGPVICPQPRTMKDAGIVPVSLVRKPQATSPNALHPMAPATLGPFREQGTEKSEVLSGESYPSGILYQEDLWDPCGAECPKKNSHTANPKSQHPSQTEEPSQSLPRGIMGPIGRKGSISLASCGLTTHTEPQTRALSQVSPNVATKQLWDAWQEICPSANLSPQ